MATNTLKKMGSTQERAGLLSLSCLKSKSKLVNKTKSVRPLSLHGSSSTNFSRLDSSLLGFKQNDVIETEIGEDVILKQEFYSNNSYQDGPHIELISPV